MNTQGKGAIALCTAIGIGFAAIGCGSSAATSPATPATQGCREGTGDDLGQGARVAGQGIEEGAEVGVAGVKQAVGAAGGFIADGKQGAEQRWNERKRETNQEVAEGSAERHAEKLPPCR